MATWVLRTLSVLSLLSSIGSMIQAINGEITFFQTATQSAIAVCLWEIADMKERRQ